MTYTKTQWVNNEEPSINAENLNKMEQGIEDAQFPDGGLTGQMLVKTDTGYGWAELTFDNTPTAGSENPVTSGGLHSLLEPVASEATGQSILATETTMNTTMNALLTRLVDAHLTTEAGDLIVQDLMQGNILLAQLARNIEESGVF